MTATDPDALTERIEDALIGALRTERDDGEGGRAWVVAGFVDPADLSAAVLPIVAEEVRKAKVEALREAARYFAGGLHCADMRTTPEETVRDLDRRAAEYEAGDSDEHR